MSRIRNFAIISLIGVFLFATIPLAFGGAYEDIDVNDIIKMLNPPQQYRFAFITVEGGNVRVRKEITNRPGAGKHATNTHGALLEPGDTIQLRDYLEVMHFSVIRATGNTVTTTIRVFYEDTAPGISE